MAGCIRHPVLSVGISSLRWRTNSRNWSPEGLLKPAFKTGMPEHVAPLYHPRGFTSSVLMQTGDSVSPCTHNLTIYQVLYAVMGKSASWKQTMWQFIITHKCFDLWCFSLAGPFFSTGSHENERGLIFSSLRRDSWMPFLNHSSTPTAHLEKDVLVLRDGISGVHRRYGFINNLSGKRYQQLLTVFWKIV